MPERVLPQERSVNLADYPPYLLDDLARKAISHLDGDTVMDIYNACMAKLERLEMGDPEYDPVLQLSQELDAAIERMGYHYTFGRDEDGTLNEVLLSGIIQGLRTKYRFN